MVVNLVLLLWIRSAAKGAQSSNDVLGPVVREEFRIGREELNQTARELREEIGRNQNANTELLSKELHKIGNAQGGLLEKLTRSNESRISELRESVEKRLETLQRNNDEKLEEMRKTVEEKLQDTLEKRVTESFKIVSDQLEQVHKGVGEMQQLATGVGDLKRMLTNVKARGTWGEVQLGALLEQVLTQQQYERNVKPVPGSNEIVEFAVRLPGADDSPENVVWLPIDAKFPQEDYNRLMDASESADPDAVQKAVAALKRTVESSAADIRAKYVAPPYTTDFAILFLPTEGLYAELVRDPDVLEKLQRDHRVVLAGPTTLSAILNSLQWDFELLPLKSVQAKCGQCYQQSRWSLENLATHSTGLRNTLLLHLVQLKLRAHAHVNSSANFVLLRSCPPRQIRPRFLGFLGVTLTVHQMKLRIRKSEVLLDSITHSSSMNTMLTVTSISVFTCIYDVAIQSGLPRFQLYLAMPVSNLC